MAAYRVEVLSGAERELSRLGPVLLRRVSLVLERLAANPRAHGAERLTGVDAYRLRVGDYRVIYEVNDTTRVIYVLRIRHRGDAYRRLR